MKALLWKRGALTADLEELPLRSMSTKTQLVPSSNSLQIGKKLTVTLRDQTPRLTYAINVGLHTWRLQIDGPINA